MMIGLAGAIAASMMFRWDPNQKFATRGGKAWLLLAVGMWAAVGLMAEARSRSTPAGLPATEAVAGSVGTPQDYARPAPQPLPAPAVRGTPTATLSSPPEVSAPGPERKPAPAPAAATAAPPAPAPAPSAEPVADERPEPASWKDVGKDDIGRIAFDRLPPDEGVVSPVATSAETPDPAAQPQLDQVRAGLATWTPGRVADPVQKVRNLLYVAAVPDMLEMGPVERFLPAIVWERLRADIPADQLPGLLFWVAMHPNDGDDSAIQQLTALGLPETGGPTRAVRGRVMLYAFKLLGRLNGDIKPK